MPYPSKYAFSLPPIPCSATTTGTGSFRSSSFGGMRMRMTDAALFRSGRRARTRRPLRHVIRLGHLGQPLGPGQQPEIGRSVSGVPLVGELAEGFHQQGERRLLDRLWRIRQVSRGPLDGGQAVLELLDAGHANDPRGQHLPVGHDFGRQLEVGRRRAGHVLDRHPDRRREGVEWASTGLPVPSLGCRITPFGAVRARLVVLLDDDRARRPRRRPRRAFPAGLAASRPTRTAGDGGSADSRACWAASMSRAPADQIEPEKCLTALSMWGTARLRAAGSSAFSSQATSKAWARRPRSYRSRSAWARAGPATSSRPRGARRRMEWPLGARTVRILVRNEMLVGGGRVPYNGPGVSIRGPPGTPHVPPVVAVAPALLLAGAAAAQCPPWYPPYPVAPPAYPSPRPSGGPRSRSRLPPALPRWPPGHPRGGRTGGPGQARRQEGREKKSGEPKDKDTPRIPKTRSRSPATRSTRPSRTSRRATAPRGPAQEGRPRRPSASSSTSSRPTAAASRGPR